MTQGHDWTQPPFTKKEYYWPFWPTFFIVLAIYELVVLVFLWSAGRLSFGSWTPYFLALTLVAAPLAAILVTWIYYRFARVDLTPHTIAAMNDFGVRQTLTLGSIDRAYKPWYGLNLLFLLKSNAVATRLWIPLYMVGWDDFAHAVRQVTPPDNPLHQFIAAYKTK